MELKIGLVNSLKTKAHHNTGGKRDCLRLSSVCEIHVRQVLTFVSYPIFGYGKQDHLHALHFQDILQ